MPGVKIWGNRMMSRLVSRPPGAATTTCRAACGATNRKSMLNLNLMGAFTYTQEVFLNLAFSCLRIVEVPIKVRGEASSARAASPATCSATR